MFLGPAQVQKVQGKAQRPGPGLCIKFGLPLHSQLLFFKFYTDCSFVKLRSRASLMSHAPPDNFSKVPAQYESSKAMKGLTNCSLLNFYPDCSFCQAEIKVHTRSLPDKLCHHHSKHKTCTTHSKQIKLLHRHQTPGGLHAILYCQGVFKRVFNGDLEGDLKEDIK